MIRTLQTFPKIVNTSYALLACDCVLCILSYGSLTKYNDQHNYSNAAICGICKSHNNCINTLKCWIYAKRAGHGQWPFKLCHSSAVAVRRVGGGLAKQGVATSRRFPPRTKFLATAHLFHLALIINIFQHLKMLW